MIEWDSRHGNILTDFLGRLDNEKIRWFILRGYEGLPDSNRSKDVDIVVAPGQEKSAGKILQNTFRDRGLKQFYPVVFGHAHCYLGMNLEEHFSIHIDLIEGYVSKGFEVITFDEMYAHTRFYNGMRVLDDVMNSVMLVVYKIFGYKNAKLKDDYCAAIQKAYGANTAEFCNIIEPLFGANLGSQIRSCIEAGDFEDLVKLEPDITKKLKVYTVAKRPVKTLFYNMEFLLQKFGRVILFYRKHVKSFAVLAPDGTGKTTFLDALLEELNFFYVNLPEENRFHVYHFRPSVLPNLGAAGEKAGVMKQDTNFSNPHRSKPANPLSSLIRIAYYTMDYILGWMLCVRKDVQYDSYSVFDRYSYDFIVDPRRTKLGLPDGVRKFFVSLTPQPRIVFVLSADSEVIYKRKQELTVEEITRQTAEYRKLAASNPKRFKIISAEQAPTIMAKEAAEMIIREYTQQL